jgi:hypothetical protein
MENVLVVMPYLEQWSERVWDAFRQIHVKDTKKRLEILRADTKVPSSDHLQAHIEWLNKNSKIVIADITTSNPNVLIEVGIALAIGTPLLLVTQERNKIPTHLKGWIVDEYTLEDESLERLSSNLLLRIEEKLKYLDAKRGETAIQVKYQVECYSNRDIANLHLFFRDALSRIDILTTNLSFLFEEYNDTGISYFNEIQTAMDRPESKLKIRILTLDPESDFAAKRGRQLGYAPQVFRDILRKALSDILDISTKYPKQRFEVRTYDDFPNQIMYRIDDHIFHCVVAQPTASRKHLTFKLNRNHSGVNTSFTDHFQSIWSKVT